MIFAGGPACVAVTLMAKRNSTLMGYSFGLCEEEPLWARMTAFRIWSRPRETGRIMEQEKAVELLRRLGAPARLLVHVELVAEAGEAIISELMSLGTEIDQDFIRCGIVLHDVGKTVHLLELSQEGELHGETGRALLLREGIEPRVAEVCLSHSAWREANTVEELVIACADKLWKGKRVTDLEELLARRVNDELQLDFWEVFTRLDSCFEAIASCGDERLERSRPPV